MLEFRQVIAHPLGLDLFTAHLQAEFAVENILFYKVGSFSFVEF